MTKYETNKFNENILYIQFEKDFQVEEYEKRKISNWERIYFYSLFSFIKEHKVCLGNPPTSLHFIF